MLTPLQHHSNTSPPHPTRLLFSNLLYSVTDARLNLSIRYQDVCAQQKEKGEQERLTGFGGPREQMRVSDNGHSVHRVTFPTQLFVGPVCCREESGPLFGHGAEWRPWAVSQRGNWEANRASAMCCQVLSLWSYFPKGCVNKAAPQVESNKLSITPHTYTQRVRQRERQRDIGMVLMRVTESGGFPSKPVSNEVSVVPCLYGW